VAFKISVHPVAANEKVGSIDRTEFFNFQFRNAGFLKWTKTEITVFFKQNKCFSILFAENHIHEKIDSGWGFAPKTP